MRFPISPEAVKEHLKKHRNVNEAHDNVLTFGDRLADNVARWGGSWNFIIVAGVVLVVWTVGNSLSASYSFDPYPFVFLNLILSMIAALQAPIIMMSQNRQALKDRLSAQADFDVNCHAEDEILKLHEKFDAKIEDLNRATAEGIKAIQAQLEQLIAARTP